MRESEKNTQPETCSGLFLSVDTICNPLLVTSALFQQAGVFIQPVAESFLTCVLFSTDCLTLVPHFNTWGGMFGFSVFSGITFSFSSTPQAPSFIMCQSHLLNVSLDIDAQPIGELCAASTKLN